MKVSTAELFRRQTQLSGADLAKVESLRAAYKLNRAAEVIPVAAAEQDQADSSVVTVERDSYYDRHWAVAKECSELAVARGFLRQSEGLTAEEREAANRRLYRFNFWMTPADQETMDRLMRRWGMATLAEVVRFVVRSRYNALMGGKS